MGNISYNRETIENAITTAFRRQLPDLELLFKGQRAIPDKSERIGFNPIPENQFCGEGTYKMLGWVSIRTQLEGGGIHLIKTTFNVTVIVKKENDKLNITFQQPIILQEKL